MPTPVNTAKQCLNPEACNALDEAVAVARCRGHSQTTSIHAVSSFLSLSPSQLKQACVRARNAAFYNPKVQLKALEFSLSVSLDRLPVSQACLDEPHVSNSLMAAIKRSQANQRRHPECIMAVQSSNHGDLLLGHSQDQNFGSISSAAGVKVDLEHLIVSILDDPIVSRVFNDAGFSSFDVKLAVLRPFQGLYRYPDSGLRRIRVPFSGPWDEEGEYRRVVELLRRKKGRNPLLVGVGSDEVLKGFLEVLERKKGFLPMDICGINVVSIEEELTKFETAKLSYDAIEWRFKEVDLMVEQCLGPGLMVNIGDVKRFLGKLEGGCEMDVVNCVVRKLTKLLEIHGGRVWIIGSAANDQTYMEFMSRFPLIDKDWDLQPLPITSIKSSMGESWFQSSLMRSFVPLGGFFSTPPGPEVQFSSTIHCDMQRNVFDGRFLQDLTTLSKTVGASVGADTTLDHLKAKRGALLLSGGVVTELQKNAEDTYQGQKLNLSSTKTDCIQLTTNVGRHCAEQEVKTFNNESSCTIGFCGKKYDCGKIGTCVSMDVHKQLASQSSKQVYLESPTNDNFLAKLSGIPPKSEHPCENRSCSPYNQTSSSGVSILTDLGLGLQSQVCKQQKKVDADVEDEYHFAKGSNHSSLSYIAQDVNSFKELFKALFGIVGRQSEALGVVSQIVAQSWISNGSHQSGCLRRGIWLNFIGPDVFGKRKTALALSEILYGSKKYLVHVNLSSEDLVIHQKKVFGYPIISDCDAKFRGKTVIDRIAEELRKTPFSVVLLENVQSADTVAQSSLLQAIRNGKFSDSYGREVSLTNRVIVLTSGLTSSMDKSSKFPEARMDKAKGWPLQLVIKGGDYNNHQNSFLLGPEKNISNQILCKRKLNNTNETIRHATVDQVKRPHKGPSLSLDLNLPAEVTEEDDTNVVSWLDELSDQRVDKTLVKVVFDPYNYDALAEKILKLVYASFCKATDSKCLLEIEPQAMDQIMAAACLSESDKKVEDWINKVLSKSFADAQKTYQLTSHSIVMLTTCEGEAPSTGDQVTGIYLPSKVGVT